MGTGIVSILLFNLPFNATWLYWISVAIFALNVLLFALVLTISVLRYTLFRGVWNCMIRHPVQSLFLGTFPMGLATIVNMVVFVCVPAWGHRFVTLAWVLWWIDVACAVGTNFYLPFIIMCRHESSLQTMTAVWLLPIVSTIVAAASGGIVASVLSNENALITIVTSYILWGCGVPLALFTMVIYFQRLTIYKLPPREVIVSVFLPLGPLGQGSFGIMQLGKQTLRISKEVKFLPDAPITGQVFYAVGVLVAFVLWGFGLVWLFFALSSITR
ncbi:sulfite transporter Ssu1, partial [Fusarium denticulatum]